MKDIILCAICGKECNGQVTGGHLKTHGTNTREYELKYGSAKTDLFSARARVWAAKGGSKSSGGAKQKEAAALRKMAYLSNPSRCKVCSEIIAYEKSNQNKHFCGSSCAAKHNNTKRERKYHCLSCATPLSRKGKYCNQACQYEAARQDRYKLWKAGEDRGGSDVRFSSSLRPLFLAENNNQCSLCHWGQLHPKTGTSPLHVDHINGDCTDHRYENLRVLCPNCHSLTETFGAHNRGNKGRAVRRRERAQNP